LRDWATPGSPSAEDADTPEGNSKKRWTRAKQVGAAYNDAIGVRAGDMVSKQLKAIWYESFCGMVMWDGEPLSRFWDDKIKDYDYAFATQAELDACVSKWAEQE
jgi:hypothetical protein